MKSSGTIAVLAAAVAMSACGGGDFSKAEADELASREQRLAARLASPSGDPSAPLARWVLPPQLLEISGLALNAEGNLLAHDDEHALVYTIDPRRGVVLKQFHVGKSGMRGDFEGIAVRGPDVFLMESNGTVHRFREGNDGDRVEQALIDTKLGKECEFEGIAVDPAGVIVLACKNIGKDGPKDAMVIYRWDPKTSRATPLIVPYAQAIGANSWKKLSPSDITIDPTTGNYVVITAQEKALIVLTPGGEVLRSGALPERPRQPEGVAISTDGILYISDEGSAQPATISLYRWPLPAVVSSDESPSEGEEQSR